MVEDILSTLREIESGGDYRKRGASGEMGAYQFMPGTWRDYSQEYIRANSLPHARLPMSPEWQDKVAGFKVKQLLDEGRTPQEIASVWNSGSPQWEGKRGVNAQGVAYDVPAYVGKFSKNLAGRIFDNLFSPGTAEAAEIRWPGEEAVPSVNGNQAAPGAQMQIRWPGEDQPPEASSAPNPNQPPGQASKLPVGLRVARGAYELLEPTIDAGAMTGGAVLGAPAGPGGSILGAGLGYGIAQPLKEAARGALGLPSDQPQNIPDVMLKSGKDVAEGVAMEMGGGIVGKGLGALAGGARALKGSVGDFARKTIGAVDNPQVGAPARQVYEDFQNAGVTPLPGAVSGNRAVQGLEEALSKMPGGSKVTQDATNKALRELGAESERVAGEFSPGVLPSKEALGEWTLGKAAEVGQRFKTQSNRVFGTVDKKIGDALSDAAATLAWVDDAASKLSPEAAASFRKSVAPFVDPLKKDAEAGALNFRSLRYWRTKISERLGNPLVADTDSASRGVLKKLEGSLTRDMEAAAQREGQLDLFKNADAWYSGQKHIMGRIENLVKSGDIKRIGDAVTSPNVSSETLAALRRKFSTDDWDVLAGTTFGQLGKAKPGAQSVEGDIFSPGTFLTNWAKLSNEAKQVLFGGTRYGELRSQIDRVARVSAAMKSKAAMENISNTASSSLWTHLMSNLGPTIGGTAGYAAWGLPGVIAGVGTGMVTPYVVSKKLMTNPDFCRWLANSGRTLLNGPPTKETVSRMIGRLAVVGNRNPDIAEDVAAYVRALGANAGGNE